MIRHTKRGMTTARAVGIIYDFAEGTEFEGPICEGLLERAAAHLWNNEQWLIGTQPGRFGRAIVHVIKMIREREMRESKGEIVGLL